MIIASRIRKVREYRGMKQTGVASLMGITQQAYSCLEQAASNARLETLKRFCEVMKVELPFLIAVDVPITDETMEHFGSTRFNDILTNYKKLEQKAEVLSDMVTSSSKKNSVKFENVLSVAGK